MTDTNTIASDQAAAKDRVGAIAAMLDGYAPFGLHVGEAIVAKAVMQYSVIQAMNDLADAAGEDELQTWPVIGTEAAKGHNNPDKYSVFARVNGEMKERKTDFVREVIQHVGKGRDLQAVIDAVNEAKDDPTKTAHPVISKLLRAEDRRTAKAEAEQELSVYRGTVRNGLRLWQKIWEFEGLALIDQTFLQEIVLETYYVNAKGEEVSSSDPSGSTMRRPLMVKDEETGKLVNVTRIKRTPKPVCIADANDPKSFVLMSVGSFLNVDVDAIKLAGGTFEGFLKTKKRDRDEEEIDNAQENVVVNNLATFETATAGINNWLEQDVNMELLSKKFRNAIKSKKLDDVASLAESIREVHIHTKALFDLAGTILETVANAKASKAA